MYAFLCYSEHVHWCMNAGLSCCFRHGNTWQTCVQASTSVVCVCATVWLQIGRGKEGYCIDGGCIEWGGGVMYNLAWVSFPPTFTIRLMSALKSVMNIQHFLSVPPPGNPSFINMPPQSDRSKFVWLFLSNTLMASQRQIFSGTNTELLFICK